MPKFRNLLFLAAVLLASPASAASYYEQVEPYVAFIEKNLLRDIAMPGWEGRRALVETEHELEKGNTWFWTDDNGKALEALIAPEVFAHHRAAAGDLVRFVHAMSEGPLIIRRLARPGLDVVKPDPGDFSLHSGLVNTHGNLNKGTVLQSYRFHDGRTVDAVRFTGNYVSFRLDGTAHTVDVEDTIREARLERQGDSVVLSHRSRIELPRKILGLKLGGNARHVGDIVYRYSLSGKDTSVRLDIEVHPAAGTVLEDAVVTSGVDQVSLNGAGPYTLFCAARTPGASDCRSNVAGGAQILGTAGLRSYSLFQEGTPGFSYGIHTQVLEPGKLHDIVAEGTTGGRFHWVHARYALGTLSDGRPGSVSERKLLTSGTLYKEPHIYDALLERIDALRGADPSVTYDYGAELNALACYGLFASRGAYGPAEALPMAFDEVRSWFDRQMRHYEVNFLGEKDGKHPFVFTRGLAFSVMGLDCMYRATGEQGYLDALRRQADLLLRFQISASDEPDIDGAIRCDIGESSVFLDCHAAALLGLARASMVVDDPRLADAIARAVKVVRTVALEKTVGAQPFSYRGLAVRKSPADPAVIDDGYWTYKKGLMLRAAAVIRIAAAEGRIDLAPDVADHLDRIEKAATDYMELVTRRRDDGTVELKTAPKSGETNSETQPWVLLGLHPIEPQILALRPQGR